MELFSIRIQRTFQLVSTDIINEELFEMSTQESPPRGSLSPLLGNIIPMNWIGT